MQIDIISLLAGLAVGAIIAGIITWLALRGRMIGLAAQVAQEQRTQQALRDTFRALSAEALQQNNDAFLRLAETRLKQAEQVAQSDLEARQVAIHHLVTPLKESVDKLEALTRGETSSLRQYLESLQKDQLNLRTETENLNRALRSPISRGRWGELLLERIFELAGMRANIDFFAQVSRNGEDGRIRPDYIVRMPGGKELVIDVKTPLDAYRAADEASEDNIRLDFLKRHASQVRDHVRQLANKSYWKEFSAAPDFVVLFLPGENLFRAAVEYDCNLLEESMEKGVMLVSPASMLALLKAVALGRRHEAQIENARAIATAGRELYESVGKLADHFIRLGKGLHNAVDSYNDAMGSVKRNLLSKARKLAELKAVAPEKELPEIPTIEIQPRALEALTPDEPAAKDDAA